MKVLERIVDGFIRQLVSIDDSQFGFVPGRGTTDAIFVVRLFVCVEVLRPSQPNRVMSSAVSLPNHTFNGQA